MKIFVGSIRDYITEEILREHFSPYGTVEAIMHKGSYAFVFMPDDSEANSACQALHRTELMGCTMNVENAKPSAVGAKPVFNSSVAAGALGSAAGGTAQHIKMESQGLVVSGVTNGASENATGGNPRKHPKFHHIQGRIKLIIGNIGDTDKTKLETYFQTFGTVYETFIMEGKGVGFCHVDEMKAEHMIEAAHGTELNGHEIRVTYSANKDLKRKPNSNTQYVKLYVPGVSQDASEDMVKARFEIFGDVQDIRLHKKSSSPDNTCVCFLKIDASVAEYAINCLSGIPFYGKPLRPQIAKGEAMAPVQVYPEATKSIPAPMPMDNGMGSHGMKREMNGHGSVHPGMHMSHSMGSGLNMGAVGQNFANMPNPLAQQMGNARGNPMGMPGQTGLGPGGMPGPGQSNNFGVQPSFAQPLYPAHNELASLEIGPGFGPNQTNTKMASLPPPPQNENELKDIIKKRCKLEMVHPYEKLLIENYDGNSKAIPNLQPTPEYLRLVRDRAILKVQLLRAQERGFDVYGTAAQIYSHNSNTNDPYGFGSNPTAENGTSNRAVSISVPATGLGEKIEENDATKNEAPGLAPFGNRPDDYAVAYGNNQAAGGPIHLRKEFVPRRTPY